MTQNKTAQVAQRWLALGAGLLLLSPFLAFGEESAPPEKAITLVDSVTLPCKTKTVARTSCELYLVYDSRDDVVYVVKRMGHKKDRRFAAAGPERNEVQREAIQTIDLVSVFADKKVPVENYSAGFNKSEGVLRIRVSVLFEGDTTPTDKFIPLILPKN